MSARMAVLVGARVSVAVGSVGGVPLALGLALSVADGVAVAAGVPVAVREEQVYRPGFWLQT
jgi:hypothetical protein